MVEVIRNVAFPVFQYRFHKIQMHLMSIIGDEHISIFQSKGIVYLIANVVKGYHVRQYPIQGVFHVLFESIAALVYPVGVLE